MEAIFLHVILLYAMHLFQSVQRPPYFAWFEKSVKNLVEHIIRASFSQDRTTYHLEAG